MAVLKTQLNVFCIFRLVFAGVCLNQPVGLTTLKMANKV